jgi:hypothetical protein
MSEYCSYLLETIFINKTLNGGLRLPIRSLLIQHNDAQRFNTQLKDSHRNYT